MGNNSRPYSTQLPRRWTPRGLCKGSTGTSMLPFLPLLMFLTADDRNPASPYIYRYMDFTTRNPIHVVYEVHRRPCRIFVINSSAGQAAGKRGEELQLGFLLREARIPRRAMELCKSRAGS